MNVLSERARLALLCLLLFLMLGILAFTAVHTFQMVRSFQQQVSAARAGDVSAIHPWMTIRVISHIYHVPESYLYRSLHIANPGPYHHATLYTIANRKRQPVDQVVRAIRYAILTYRKQHPHFLTPTPHTKPLSHTPGRTKY